MIDEHHPKPPHLGCKGHMALTTGGYHVPPRTCPTAITITVALIMPPSLGHMCGGQVRLSYGRMSQKQSLIPSIHNRSKRIIVAGGERVLAFACRERYHGWCSMTRSITVLSWVFFDLVYGVGEQALRRPCQQSATLILPLWCSLWASLFP